MCELSWKIYQPWITFSTYMNVKPLNQSILSCQDYSIRKNEASKNHFNSHHLIYIWFLKIIFLGQVSNDYCFGLQIEMSRLIPAGWGHYVVFLVMTLYSQSALLHSGVWMGTTSKCWGQPCYGLACHSAEGSRNISSCSMLWKLG